MAVTTSASVTELAEIGVTEAKIAMVNRQDLTKLCTIRPCKEGEESKKFPKWNELTASAQASQAVDITGQEMSAAGVTLTPTVAAALVVPIGDLAKHNAPQIMADFGKAAAKAIVKKRNADIFALCAGFSNAVGSTGVDVSAATIQAAVKIAKDNGADEEELFFLYTTAVWNNLLTELASSSALATLLSDRAKEAVLAGKIDEGIKLFGATPVLVTSGIDQSGDVNCGLISRNAIGYCEAWPIKIEFERRARGVATDAVASCAYAVGEIDDSQGVTVLVDGN